MKAALLYHILIIYTIIGFICAASHSNNWAIIVSTSKYFFNYRHNANALTVYNMVKEQGIPDSNIILMLPEDVACSPRNVIPGTVYNNESRHHNIFHEMSLSVDYKGDDVTVENILRLLTGRHISHIPQSKRLLSDNQSNILIYFSGHGGDQFMKIRDSEIITAQDISLALHEMHIQQRYNNILFLVDTCQANTFVETVNAPNIITASSSLRGENSYSHGGSVYLGLSLVDKFTFYLQSYYTKTMFKETLYDLFNIWKPQLLSSTPAIRTDLMILDDNNNSDENDNSQRGNNKISTTASNNSNGIIPLDQQKHILQQHRILDFFGASHAHTTVQLSPFVLPPSSSSSLHSIPSLSSILATKKQQSHYSLFKPPRTVITSDHNKQNIIDTTTTTTTNHNITLTDNNPNITSLSMTLISYIQYITVYIIKPIINLITMFIVPPSSSSSSSISPLSSSGVVS